jgi:hypothetical protein
MCHHHPPPLPDIEDQVMDDLRQMVHLQHDHLQGLFEIEDPDLCMIKNMIMFHLQDMECYASKLAVSTDEMLMDFMKFGAKKDPAKEYLCKLQLACEMFGFKDAFLSYPCLYWFRQYIMGATEPMDPGAGDSHGAPNGGQDGKVICGVS